MIDENLNLYLSSYDEVHNFVYNVVFSERYLAGFMTFLDNKTVEKENFIEPDIIETLIPMLEKLMYEDAR